MTYAQLTQKAHARTDKGRRVIAIVLALSVFTLLGDLGAHRPGALTVDIAVLALLARRWAVGPRRSADVGLNAARAETAARALLQRAPAQ